MDDRQVDDKIATAVALAQAKCPLAHEMRQTLNEMRVENSQRHREQMHAISGIREGHATLKEQTRANRRDIDAHSEELRTTRRSSAARSWGVIASIISAAVAVVIGLLRQSG